jgi:hypothetical protein
MRLLNVPIVAVVVVAPQQMVALVRPTSVDSGKLADIIISIIGMQLPSNTGEGKCVSDSLTATTRVLLNAGLQLAIGAAIPIIVVTVHLIVMLGHHCCHHDLCRRVGLRRMHRQVSVEARDRL